MAIEQAQLDQTAMHGAWAFGSATYGAHVPLPFRLLRAPSRATQPSSRWRLRAGGAAQERAEQDNAAWQARIDRDLATPDPVLSNLRITTTHYQLSLALREVLGPRSGANFHTWATWGSKKAGQTIRQEEAPHIRMLAAVIGGAFGLLITATALHAHESSLWLACAGAVIGGAIVRALAGWCHDQASRMVLGGNVTVLDDIGRQTARFVTTFRGHPDPDPQRLAEFLKDVRPGASERGGQDLLRKAFTHYYLARHAANRQIVEEEMLLANLYAILHEHIRLQPYIAGAMPRPARRWITRSLLTFSLGSRTMSVGRDVVPLSEGDRLKECRNSELRQFLETWDRARGGVAGSRAHDWSDIRDRMAFICPLFRTSHNDPGLYSAPYSGFQQAGIESGRVPSGAL